MAVFVAKRLGYALVVLALIMVIVSLLLRMIPGDPVDVISAGNPGMTQADKVALRRELGLDGTAIAQVGRYLDHLVHGNMGESLQFRIPVSELVFQRLPATIELTLAGLLVAILIAVPIGIVAALKRDRLPDYAGSVFVVVGFSMPSFLLGILLIFLFSVEFTLLPSSGREVSLFRAIADGSLSEVGTALRYLCLPAIALGVSLAAWSARMIRSAMLEALRQDYVRFARAKGLPGRVVVLRHALRNALIPVITVLGLQLGYLLSGAFIVENVFAWPGLGRTTVQAIFYRDYPVVQGVVLVTAALFLAVNLLVDVVYALVDPRIRLS
jgi:peptide/nickel transport system permease protein